MDQTYSYAVVVKNSAKAVIVPLKDCMCCLNRVCEALIDADVDRVTGYCSNYDYIRQQIVQSWRSLQHSDQAATACLRSLDVNLENLTQNEGTLERQKKATKQTLDDLRTKQASNKKVLEESQEALDQAKMNLRSTRDTLERQEQRVEKAKVLTSVGLGITPIPFVGWVVGPALVIGGLVEISEASRAVEIAEKECDKFKNQVDKYKDKVCDHKSKIDKTKNNIGEIDSKLMWIREDIHSVRKQRRQLSELQRKTRSAVHVLSVLCGKVNVCEMQTRRFILHEPVKKVMEEVMESAEEITGSEFLRNKGVLRLVDKMRQNSRRLRAICAAQNDYDDDDDDAAAYM